MQKKSKSQPAYKSSNYLHLCVYHSAQRTKLEFYWQTVLLVRTAQNDYEQETDRLTKDNVSAT